MLACGLFLVSRLNGETMRIIQERCEYGNGIYDEWQPSSVVITGSDTEVMQAVRKLNAEQKRIGSNIRYRSISDDSGNGW